MLPPLSRGEIARILRATRGSQTVVAERAGVSRASVAAWLRGSTSANIAGHAETVARELLQASNAIEDSEPSAREVVDQLRSTRAS